MPTFNPPTSVFDPEAAFPGASSVPSGSGVQQVQQQHQRERRGSVSAESYDPARGSHIPTPVIAKTAEQRARLEVALRNNLLTARLSEEARRLCLDAMFERRIPKGVHVIREGEVGDNWYIVEQGSFVIERGGVIVNRAGAGDSFGELALLYNQPRAASVIAEGEGDGNVVWCLDGFTFRKVQCDLSHRDRQLRASLVGEVPLFLTLTPLERNRVSDALIPLEYGPGETIIQQGDLGQEFFIIAEGEAEVIRNGETVNRLKRGDYFGELALLNSRPRAATVKSVTGLTCLVLSRTDFHRLMGPLLPYLQRNADHYRNYADQIDQ